MLLKQYTLSVDYVRVAALIFHCLNLPIIVYSMISVRGLVCLPPLYKYSIFILDLRIHVCQCISLCAYVKDGSGRERRRCSWQRLKNVQSRGEIEHRSIVYAQGNNSSFPCCYGEIQQSSSRIWTSQISSILILMEVFRKCLLPVQMTWQNNTGKMRISHTRKYGDTWSRQPRRLETYRRL